MLVHSMKLKPQRTGGPRASWNVRIQEDRNPFCPGLLSKNRQGAPRPVCQPRSIGTSTTRILEYPKQFDPVRRGLHHLGHHSQALL